MEMFLNPYDKECMKMAMLKHEETFKEQVYELHRLYRIQKMLMKNMKSSSRHCQLGPDRWRLENVTGLRGVNYINEEQQNPHTKLDLECPAEEYIMDEGGDELQEIEDEIDIELTLGPRRFRRRKKDEMPLNLDTGPSFSSSSTDSSFIQRKSRMNPREELTGHEWELIQVPNVLPSFQSGKSAFDFDEQLRQERLNQPPWLFQVLNLNMT